MNKKDITGQKFGKLTVIKRVGSDKNYNTLWLCKCECGNEKVVARYRLINGNTSSCGCAKKIHFSNLNKIHGLSNTKIYYAWRSMKHRCLNPNNDNYLNYGSRGITICDEWLADFMNFYNWSMSNGYKEGLSIDRIDVNGNYEPSNCRWITPKEQSRNTRRNHYITYNNETYCISEWAEKLSIDYYKLKNMLHKTNDFEKAITILKSL